MPLYATNTSARVWVVFKSFLKAMSVEREAWPTLITQSLETPEEEMFADTNGISPTIQ